MDRDGLEAALDDAFPGNDDERRVVVRQALDLADSGRWAATHDGAALTPERIVEELGQAPSGESLVDRWNWWIGSLEVAYGGFERFGVRRWGHE